MFASFVFCFCLLAITVTCKPSPSISNEQKRNGKKSNSLVSCNNCFHCLDKYMHPYTIRQRTIETRSLDEEIAADYWRYAARNTLREKIEIRHNISKCFVFFY